VVDDALDGDEDFHGRLRSCGFNDKLSRDGQGAEEEIWASLPTIIGKRACLVPKATGRKKAALPFRKARLETVG
jgi:hypothetical protein